MTGEELKKSFERLHNTLLGLTIILILLMGFLMLVYLGETRRLICSSDNPPKTCKE